MRLTDYLNPRCISVDMKAKNKEEALKFLAHLLLRAGNIPSEKEKEIVKILRKREELGSTGVGYGVGIPHGKSSLVKEIMLAIAISKEGVDFDSLDGEPVHLFFLLLGPEDSEVEHLKALARIARFSKDRVFRSRLLRCKLPKEVLEVIKEKEEKELI